MRANSVHLTGHTLELLFVGLGNMNSAHSVGEFFLEALFRMVLKCLRKASRNLMCTEKHLNETRQKVLNRKPEKNNRRS